MKRIIVFSCAALMASAAMAQNAPRDQDQSRQYQHSQQDQDHNRDQDQHSRQHDRSAWNHERQDSRQEDREGHRWQRGHRVTAQYRSSRYVVSDYNRYHLRQPPRGYHWVRDDNNNFLLVAISSGIIADLLLHSQ